MGHPEPFQLEYVAVGNEDCGKKNYRGELCPVIPMVHDIPCTQWADHNLKMTLAYAKGIFNR